MMKSPFPIQIELQSLPDPNHKGLNNERAQPFFFLLFLLPLCGMWDLVPGPEIEHGPPALGEQGLSNWTTREVPSLWQDTPEQQQHRLHVHPSPQSFPVRTDSPAVTSGCNCHSFLGKPMFLSQELEKQKAEQFFLWGRCLKCC